LSDVIHFEASIRRFEAYGEDPQKASISRLVGPEISKSMGAGIARFDECSIAWTVLYDELIVTLEGRFVLRVGDQKFVCVPGDVLWIPANTPLYYEGVKATVFYALSPVDWKQRSREGVNG
jgi:ethanolamine utilization protein EutQ